MFRSWPAVPTSKASTVDVMSPSSWPDTASPARDDCDPFAYRGPVLAEWQQDALRAWFTGDSRGTTRGTLEVFTGGGKTLLALAAAAQLSAGHPCLRLLGVVPTQALQAQWVEEIRKQTTIPGPQIGRLGGGRSDDLLGKRALVAVLNSAARKLPELCSSFDPADLMLVVDECHRAGAPQFSRVLQTPADYRLGLSATPEREETNEAGEILTYDEQLLGQKLGEVVFSFDLRRAREVGWLPEYRIVHHGVALTDPERQEYNRVTRQIDDLTDRLRAMGKEPSQARQLSSRSDEVGLTANAYVGATAKRKDLLYKAKERHRVSLEIVRSTYESDPSRRTLLFHERVDEAAALHEALSAELSVPTALEHSRLPQAQRRKALADFAAGRVSVLVSVKSLIEGVNVPASDVGLSVASSSSVRQRVQSLGRVLRRRFDGETKRADMHIIYVADTVDDLIYGKEDWSDLTGESTNTYFRWPLAASMPVDVGEPPRAPRPTEEMEWQRLGERAPSTPVPWLGSLPDADYSIDARGTAVTPSGDVIRDDQGVGDLITNLRGTPGGRFKVTPRHHLVLVFHAVGDGPPVSFVVGQLARPFEVLGEGGEDFDVASLRPGDPYPGPRDKTGGTFKLRQKAGGILERRGGPRGGEFARSDGADQRSANVRVILAAWRSTALPGMPIFRTGTGHVWYLDGGRPYFLGVASEGFAWPSDEREEADDGSN